MSTVRIDDSRLRQHVLEELADDPHLDASTVEVFADSARITLTGTVQTRAQRRAAERAAWMVDMVRDVRQPSDCGT
jgi:osmotically-inducible protein OsmY